jgi:hypothetical protein
MRKLGGSGKRQIKSLQGNDTFKFYITLDHHSPGLKLSYRVLSSSCPSELFIAIYL